MPDETTPQAPDPNAAQPVDPVAPVGGGADQGGGSVTPDAPSAAGVATPPVEDPIAAAVARAVSSAISPLVDRLASLETRPATPAPAPAPAIPDNSLDKEVTLRKEQLAAIRRGDLDPSYEPEVQERLADAVAAKREAEAVSRVDTRQAFVDSYNRSLASAYEEYPALKDTSSELYKETVRILSEDPMNTKIIQALKPGNHRADFSSLDGRINLRAAREASAVLARKNAGKPLSQQVPNPNLAKTGLERGHGAPAPEADADLSRLEAEAVSTGDQGAWTRYIAARDRRLKARNA